MSHDPLHIASLCWVGDKHHSEEISCIMRDIVRKYKGGRQDIVVQLVDVVAVRVGWVIVERKIARQHRILYPI